MHNSSDMPIIDLHAHLHPFPLPVRKVNASDLLLVMDRLGVQVTAVSSAEAILCDMAAGNARLARDVAAHDRLRGYVFGNPNFLGESAEQFRRYLDQERFIGAKLYSGGYVGKPIDCPEHAHLLELLATEFPWAVVLFHCGENDPANFAGLVAQAERFPDLTFIAGHMGSKLWRDALPVLCTRPNIIAEISAPVPARSRIEDAVSIMGPERVIFGSDFPIISQVYMLGCVADARIPGQTRRAILYDNPRRILAQAEAR